MRTLPFLFLLATTPAFSAPAPAAPAAPSATAGPVDSEAAALIDRHITALGGAERIAALKSLALEGHMRVTWDDGGLEFGWHRYQRRPSVVRVELALQGLHQTVAFDGRDAWSVQPFGGRRDPQPMAADQTRAFALSNPFDDVLVEAKRLGLPVRNDGREDVDGTLAHKLTVSRPDGTVQHVYLDPDFLMLFRVETHVFQRGAEVVDETDFGNFEQVAGVWMPFAQDSGAKGGPHNQRIVIDRAIADAPLADGLFQLPGAATPSPATHPTPFPAGTAVTAGSSTPPTAVQGAADFDAGIIGGLRPRNIGSAAMSGRISALAAFNQDGKTTIFVGSASGGVWRSRDGGTGFEPVFDRETSQSIGALAVDPRNHKTIWAGTGESWTRNSVSIGDGIYKSTDGGSTWQRMGLEKTERITRIVVSPDDSDTVYACAPGPLWSDSPDRGLYQTTDGGKTWRQILKGGNLSTGCSSLSLEPGKPDTLLAGLWDFRRQGWTFRSGGEGPDAPSGSGLFRSLDRGRTFSELTPENTPGLPAKPWGRVEVVHAPSRAQRLYVFIEAKKSGLFVSDDGGKTFEARDKSQMMVWRPFYFARMVVDPTNPDRVFKANGGLIVSDDAGRSFSGSGGGAHGDWHDLWIDEANPKHIIGGDDGGLWLSQDGGNRWWKGDNLPISQFYHVAVDDADPYHVYGGLQDNSSWIGESSFPGGVGNGQWDNLFGGDGFYTLPDPFDDMTVYAESQGGHIGRIDRKTRAARNIQPQAGYHEKLRFNWNTPIHVSPTRRNTVYIGAQFLFRSTDRGDTWQRISPDLTTNDPAKQKQEQSGGITVDNSSAEMHTSLYAISESPLNARVVWVGTDDGNLQVTRNDGHTWENVVSHVTGLPAGSWVSSVAASRFQAGTAYVTFDRHTFGDFEPYAFVTRDFGRTFQRIAGPSQGLRGYAHVIREDTVRPELLYVGTEFGLWISNDAGAHWAAVTGGNFPAVAVRDLALQARTGDLVIGTHGRGIWIVDDLAPLRALTPELLRAPASFLPIRPVEQRMGGVGGWANGDAKFVGENAPGSAMLTYTLRTRHLFGPLALEVSGPDGKHLDTLPASGRRGINRVPWTMRIAPPRVPRAVQIAFDSTQGARVVPGTYTAKLTEGKATYTTKIPLVVDRRAPYADADRKVQFAAVQRIGGLFERMTVLCDQLDAARSVTSAPPPASLPAALAQRLSALDTQLETQKKAIVATKEGGAITGEQRLREFTDELYGAVNGYEGKPTPYQLDRVAALDRELGDVEKGTAALFTGEVRALNAELEKLKLPVIPTMAQHAARGSEHAPADDRLLERVYDRYLWLEPALFEMDAGGEAVGVPAEND